MNSIRLMSFLYALLQMVAMLAILVAGKKKGGKGRLKSLISMPLLGSIVWVLLAAAIGFSWYMWLTRRSVLSLVLNIWINATGIPALGTLICFDRSAVFMGRVLGDERKSFALVLVCTLLSIVLITLGIVLPGAA